VERARRRSERASKRERAKHLLAETRRDEVEERVAALVDRAFREDWTMDLPGLVGDVGIRYMETDGQQAIRWAFEAAFRRLFDHVEEASELVGPFGMAWQSLINGLFDR